jgi:hypothetical protein
MTHEIHKNTTTAVIVLLVINVLLLVYVGFFKHDAVWLETMKVGGRENMTLVQQLYNSDMYKTQQTQAIQQVLSSIDQQANPLVQPTAETQPAAEVPAAQ